MLMETEIWTLSGSAGMPIRFSICGETMRNFNMKEGVESDRHKKICTQSCNGDVMLHALMGQQCAFDPNCQANVLRRDEA
jgi:hypothetical protein